MSSEIEISILAPDDMHHHFRDGEVLADNVVHMCHFNNVLVMPNIKPPVRTVAEALAYKQRIHAAAASRNVVPPNLMMTLYLTDTTTPEEISKVKESGEVKAMKLYPAGATTNSEFGVSSYDKIKPALAAMQELGIPLLLHGEVTDPDVDIFDREQVFIEKILMPLLTEFPNLDVVMEHITTKNAVDFIRSFSFPGSSSSSGANSSKNSRPGKLCATITAHHLLYNRNSLFVGGICPHMYCLPILKREEHRLALVDAATSGDERFFLGTDSAPHAVGAKESQCGCAGIFTAHAAIELYAEVFDNEAKLDLLQGFASEFGKKFYASMLGEDTGEAGVVKLRREPWTVPITYEFGSQTVRPLRAGESVRWKRVLD